MTSTPDWRVHGACPTRAAICRRSREPSSGNSAIRVRAMVFPTPGAEASSSCFSTQMADPRMWSPINLSSSASSFSSALRNLAMLRGGDGRPCDGRAEPRRRSSRRSGAGERPNRRVVSSSRRAFAAAPQLRFGCFGEMGNHRRIDRIGPFAESHRQGSPCAGLGSRRDEITRKFRFKLFSCVRRG
jgi:hypothetical protein